ncbi:MAG: ABC transporter ATP-binding protein [Syntrophorhabdaceae bacterium]|nr:ABC transporter ATP-binding protein [Syntrophorhabdaceae bacterium]MDD4195439.1 ABC transporter ATP-binding protein [Syntrophorhabdaceae bacterium]
MYEKKAIKGAIVISAIRTYDLWKEYETGGHDGIALRGIELDIAKGQIIALLGKSGSGKTTLLNLLAGLDVPTRGRVEIDGVDLQGLGEKGRTRLRRHKLGFVFQFFNLLPTLTSIENVLLALELAGRPDEKLARESIALVGLNGKEDRFPHELSGGEQQRIAIARALVKNPPIILADEPTGNLDSHTGTQILDLLTNRCRESGTTLIMVSHSLKTCQYADRILRMLDGRIFEEESYEGFAP